MKVSLNNSQAFKRIFLCNKQNNFRTKSSFKFDIFPKSFFSSNSSNVVSSSKELTPQQEEFRKNILSPWKFKFFSLLNLPMAFLSNLKILHLDRNKCLVTVPFNYLTKNPFRSTYFACLAMAGELSTGNIALMAIHKSDPPISMLVTALEAQYSKKAETLTTFTCEDGNAIFDAVEKSKITGEGQIVKALSIGRNTKQEEVCRFYVTWSFKPKSKSSKNK